MSAAWITGGGTGIGRALAGLFYKQGKFVVMSGRRHDVLIDAARAIAGGASDRLIVIPGDITDASFATNVLSTLALRGRYVDLLVNNAAQNTHHFLDQTPVDEFAEALRVNCLGAIRCTQAVVPGMRQRKSGAIVNICSVLGKFPSAGSASYSVSKYALTGFTDVLRQNLAGSGVQVLGVFPGFIRTAMTQPFVRPGSFKEFFAKTPDQMAAAIDKALRRRRAELLFPWYVPWLLRLHRWAPGAADRWAANVRGRP